MHEGTLDSPERVGHIAAVIAHSHCDKWMGQLHQDRARTAQQNRCLAANFPGHAAGAIKAEVGIVCGSVHACLSSLYLLTHDFCHLTLERFSQNTFNLILILLRELQGECDIGIGCKREVVLAGYYCLEN